MEEMTYKKAGVDIDEGERMVKLIAPMVRKTFSPGVMTDIGSFGALFRLDTQKYREPVLVSGTDGVGTKLMIAFMTGRHDTVGIDLVAMCVNDILTLGAEPLFFLDYFATGRLSAEKARDVIRGIVAGCEQAGCALIGGETAEMPGLYSEGEYDLAGFAVGVVEKSGIVDGAGIAEGDMIIGLASSGLHSNGYSLARKVFFERAGLKPDAFVPELGGSLGEALLTPTKIYVKAIQALMARMRIKGMAHITGGGIPGNLPRMLPDGVAAAVKRGSWPVPPVFALIRETGNVPDEDMGRTFNMGIGYACAVSSQDADGALSSFRNEGLDAYVIGEVVKSDKEKIRYV